VLVVVETNARFVLVAELLLVVVEINTELALVVVTTFVD